MLGMRRIAAGTFLAGMVAVMLTGCPQDVGVTLLVAPKTLEFGSSLNQLGFTITRSFTSTTAGPVVVRSTVPWIIPETCTDTGDGCFTDSRVDVLFIPVRVDRSAMTLGKNEGVLSVEAAHASTQYVTVKAQDLLQVDFTAATQTPELGRPVQFTDESLVADGDDPIISWRWNFGDGGQSVLQNPSHIYAVAGQYAVTLAVNTNSRTETVTKAAFINAGSSAPAADFQAAATSIFERDEIGFTDLSVSTASPIVARLWDFGDGHTSTADAPMHQYSKTGMYTVSLRVTTALGATDTETKTNYIIVQRTRGPQANFALSQVSPYVLIAVEFRDVSDPGTAPIEQWVWEFGDGIISLEQNPTHVYRNVGPYTVRLTVITQHGYDTATQNIEVVYKPPIAEFEADNTSPSVDEVVQFTDLSLPGVAPTGPADVDRWHWDFGDGKTSTAQNPAHAYNREGTFTVSLTIGSSDLPATITDTEIKKDYIVVIKAPEPAFSIGSDSPFTRETIPFTNETIPGTETGLTYEWTFGDNSAPVTEENPTHVYSQPGTYTVELTAKTSTREVSVSKQLVVDARPDPDFTANPVKGTTADAIQFTDTTNTTNTRPVETRLWRFGDGALSTVQNPDHMYSALGQYTVSLTITFSHSVSHKIFSAEEIKTNYITISLPTPPTASFSVETTCAAVNVPIQFTDTSTPGSAPAIISWRWTFGDGATSSLKNPLHAYARPGDYTITLQVTTEDRYAPYNTDSAMQEDYISCLAGVTALDTYVAAADPEYGFEQLVPPTKVTVSQGVLSATVTVRVMELTSQRWRTTEDYRIVADDSSVWKHHMTIVEPEEASGNTAILYINGGNNGSSVPNPSHPSDDLEAEMKASAVLQSVLVDLRQVPNQPIVFEEDRENGVDLRERTEDSIISYTYDKYLNERSAGGNEADYNTWPLLLPMVKSAVRAMDAVQDIYSQDLMTGAFYSRNPVEKFIVSGGSKRGWTTWLTAAYEEGPNGQQRVKAIAPIVIDVLNMDRQMQHHFNAYGYWAPAIYPYAQEKVFERFSAEHEQYAAALDLMHIVDPYEYRCRLENIPRYCMNSSGDQFFLPDAAQWYFDRLPGDEKYLNYVPNSDHGLGDEADPTQPGNATSGLLSFFAAMRDGLSLPQFSWSFETDGSILVRTQGTTPSSVTMYYASNADGRDFRLDKVGAIWAAKTLSAEAPGRYRASMTRPAQGYSAFYVQLKYPGPASLYNIFSYILTTPIRVLPFNSDGTNLYPVFAGKRTVAGIGADQVPVVAVHGTPEEMGRQYGGLMANEIKGSLPAFLAAAQLKYPNLSNEALDAAWDTIQAAYDPGNTGAMSRVEEELIGVAEGSGLYDPAIPEETDGLLMLRRANMVPVLAALSGNAIATTRDASMSGYTYQSCSVNWALDINLQGIPCVVIYIPGMAQGFPHANITFAGLVGSLTGVNLAGVGLSSVPDVDLSGDPYVFDLTGKHYSTLFRDILYDARNKRDARLALEDNLLFRRQHFVVADGRYLLSSFKAQSIGPEASILFWSEDDPADEFAPHTVPYTVYSGPEAGAVAAGDTDGPVIQLLRSNIGAIDQNDLSQAYSILAPIQGNTNLMNVIYEIPDDDLELNAYVSYAHGSQNAYQRPMVAIDLQSFLP
ncbi:MAG TPA: PhoPQ-activated protein PqaA family protein [Candidatus Hydrogenedentes bacterium]|nr:PhoPQ-activated protein PqaA family protein [Candidatus Hydrogenedentota bacterium]